MRSGVAQAYWIRAAAARAQGHVAELDGAISIARASEELPVLYSLLTLQGSEEAKVVAQRIALTIPDPQLRASFLKAPPLQHAPRRRPR